jgi:hypothetical protein
MLHDPAAGGQHPSEIVFAQGAEASEERIADDNQSESGEITPL